MAVSPLDTLWRSKSSKQQYHRRRRRSFMADGKTEPPGTAHFEGHGWLHQWANDSDAPLVLLQANIGEEGAPAVVMTQPTGSAPK
jgi:hypothetical protein